MPARTGKIQTADKGDNTMLLEKIQKRTATVGIIGLGYVGLPLAIQFVKSGFTVTGFDLDEEKVQAPP